MLACVTVHHSVSCMFLSACCCSLLSLAETVGRRLWMANQWSWVQGQREHRKEWGLQRAELHCRRANQWRRERRWSLNLQSKRPTNEVLQTMCHSNSSDGVHCLCVLLLWPYTPPSFPHLHLRWLTGVVVPLSSCRVASAAPLTKSSSVGGEICSLGRNDDDDDDKKRRSSFGARMMGMVGLGKKSQSASQLNPEGQSQFNQ